MSVFLLCAQKDHMTQTSPRISESARTGPLPIKMMNIAKFCLHFILASSVVGFSIQKYSFQYSHNNAAFSTALNARRSFASYNGLSYDSDLTDKLPQPMKAQSQKVMLKWFCMLRKLRDATKSVSMAELSKRTGLSSDMLETLISMASRLEQTLIWANMRLVHSIAVNYQGSGVELDDLICEGVKGLRKAVERFDSSRGCAFSTYAYPWIKEYIRMALASANPITLPRHVYKLLVKVRGVRERLYVTLGRPPTDEDLSGEMGIDVERLDIVRRAMALEARIKESTVQAEQELLAFEDEIREPIKAQILGAHLEQVESAQPPPSESVTQRDAHTAVLRALATLPEDEAKAIYHRLGLGKSLNSSTYNNNYENSHTDEEIRALYHKGVRRLRRRASDPKYPEVNALGAIFKDSQVKEETAGQIYSS